MEYKEQIPPLLFLCRGDLEEYFYWRCRQDRRMHGEAKWRRNPEDKTWSVRLHSLSDRYLNMKVEKLPLDQENYTTTATGYFEVTDFCSNPYRSRPGEFEYYATLQNGELIIRDAGGYHFHITLDIPPPSMQALDDTLLDSVLKFVYGEKQYLFHMQVTSTVPSN